MTLATLVHSLRTLTPSALPLGVSLVTTERKRDGSVNVGGMGWVESGQRVELGSGFITVCAFVLLLFGMTVEMQPDDLEMLVGGSRVASSSYARPAVSSTPRSSCFSKSAGSTNQVAVDFGSKRRSGIWTGIGGRVSLHMKFRGKRNQFKGAIAIFGLILVFFLLNWWMISRIDDQDGLPRQNFLSEGEWRKFIKGTQGQKFMCPRLLALSAHALAEGVESHEPEDLWQEPSISASAWQPCSDKSNLKIRGENTGYILVSANGGINQQRVAICNAVAVARLLNATVVVPKFLYSSVWRDESQFGDIYQEDYFINYLKDDVRIAKELPTEFQSMDLKAIGCIVNDSDIMKEATSRFIEKTILPILLKHRVVHFVGFANRLAFDSIPFQVQRLRCRCNFQALKFVHKIQKAGSLIVQRLRHRTTEFDAIYHNLLGQFAVNPTSIEEKKTFEGNSKYLAMHLRFEIDMAAYSLCDFGGGEEEKKELEAYRATHFPFLALLKGNPNLLSPSELRSAGLCPLTPEEAAIMLAAIGFKRTTRIYLAGAHIYGGSARMTALTSLYPNLVTKEDLLSPEEIRPFKNFSSQLAALDFIGCAAADSFAITDPGSQLSSLVAGYRAYYGGVKLPTIRPNKRRLAGLLLKNSTIEWNEFQVRVRKAFREGEMFQGRPSGRSIYRHPRCRECMCKMQ